MQELSGRSFKVNDDHGTQYEVSFNVDDNGRQVRVRFADLERGWAWLVSLAVTRVERVD